MKRYISPDIKVVKIATCSMLAASNETLNVTGGTHTGGFNAREFNFSDDDDFDYDDEEFEE